MPRMLNLRPVHGARVLDPDAVPVPAPLPVEGKMVEDTPYWRRRLRAGEVERVPEPADVTNTPGQDAQAAEPEKKASPAKGK